MEVKVNIKANKLTDEQQRVLVDALTDYVAEEGDLEIARDLAVRIKKGMVMLFEYEPQLTPLKDFAPKQEWSEEDEKTFSRICGIIHHAAYENYDVDEDGEELGEYARIINWFKSLKERVGCEVNCTTMWKPSKEQTEAIKDAIEFLGCTKKVREDLKSLYEQLKKLKES